MKVQGTWNFGAGSVINGKPIEDMTDAEKLAFITQMAAKGRRVVIEGFNDGKSQGNAAPEGGQMVVNNTIVQKSDDPDYWTRLEHQYAGMTMQGIVSNSIVEIDYEGDEGCFQAVAAMAYRFAHALVEKLKEESK